MTISMKPLGSRVVIEPIEQEEITAYGIVLPETAKEKPPRRAPFWQLVLASVTKRAIASRWTCRLVMWSCLPNILALRSNMTARSC